MDYYRLVTKAPDGVKWISHYLHTKEQFLELMADYERNESGTWSSHDGSEYWPVIEHCKKFKTTA
jgi:hypothetical protein